MLHRTIRILLCDDHPIVRKGLREILQQEGPGVTIVEAATAENALGLARKQPWDTLVLDFTMPGRSGLELLKQLKQERPNLPVLVLSEHPAEQYAPRVLRAGASGYLAKQSAPDELLTAVRRVVRGGRYISPSVGETLAADLGRSPDDVPHQGLSDREFEILRLLASGKRASEIAEELHLSVKTVSTYRARALRKLNLRTTAQLMRYGIAHGLVDSAPSPTPGVRDSVPGPRNCRGASVRTRRQKSAAKIGGTPQRKSDAR